MEKFNWKDATVEHAQEVLKIKREEVSMETLMDDDSDYTPIQWGESEKEDFNFSY